MTGRRDLGGFLSWACLAALFLMLITPPSNAVHEVNCRKYVFAPVCRGVAAKRSLPHSPSYLPASSNLL